MDLELREGLAFSEDRDAVLSQLLPGSADHDYYRCLRAQHRGALDEAETIISLFSRNHSDHTRLKRLEVRQWLLRAQQSLAPVRDKLRDHFGVNHWHEREVEEVESTRPSRLPDDTFTGDVMLQQAVDHDDSLSQVTDDGLYELLDRDLGLYRRRALLARIGHTPDPAFVQQVATELSTRDHHFGQLAAHQQLTRVQLEQLAREHTRLLADLNWVSAVIRRMRPARESVDLEQDRPRRHAYLAELWAFVQPLPSAITPLKVHVLWHLLDTERRLGIVSSDALIIQYLELPRWTSYANQTWFEVYRDKHRSDIASIGQDFSAVTGLPPAADDEGLVRALIHARFTSAEVFATWIDRSWLDSELATARLLYSDIESDRATRQLGPSRAAELRERIDLAWSVDNATQFGADEPIVLHADVKHVPELVVKVFRVDPHAYFVRTQREVNTDLDLDGLAASHELVLRFTDPPIRRARRSIELPMCTRPGTYVIDLIGNGTSSRAVVHKGRLRFTMRVGAAGHVVSVVDDAGRSRPDARAVIGEREYVADERGSFVVPFSTAPQTQPMLLLAGDVASVQRISLVRETVQLTATFFLDREALTAGRTARAIVRPRLTIAGALASVTLIKRALWDVTLTDRAGVSTTKTVPLTLSDDDAAVLDIPLGEDTAQLALAIRGAVEVRSEQREQDVIAARSFAIASMHATTATEALYLAHTAAGWVISALGKTGEPRARRAVAIGLTHRWSRLELDVELATDERGRIELGQLDGIARITATLGAASQAWIVVDAATTGPAIHAAYGDEIILAISPTRTAEEVLRKLSIVELREVPVMHPGASAEALPAGIQIRGLPPGTYHVRGPGLSRTLVVVDATTRVANAAFTSEEVVELTHTPPAIELVQATEDLFIQVRDATPRTRVHVLGMTFVPTLIDEPMLGQWRGHARRGDHDIAVRYVSGRELGDEYRYVLDRRAQKRFPGLLLDRPPLLLNPWARRTTQTEIAEARGGSAFAPQAQRSHYASAAAPMASHGDGDSADSYVTYDFLGEPPAVIANLAVEENGVVNVRRSALGRAAHVVIILDDPAGTTLRHVPLAEQPPAPRDLRLHLALDPARHVTQKKQIVPLRAGDTLVIEDLATAKVHLVDSVAKAHAYLLALNDDATLREFEFVTRWHELPDSERREKYSKYACHELHLFLWAKDRAFFDAVVRPHLANKRTPTFLDELFLKDDLRHWLEPALFAKLNAAERALLAGAVPAGDALARLLVDDVSVLPPDPERDTRLIDSLLGAATLDGDDQIAAYADQAETAAVGRAMAFGGGGPRPSPPGGGMLAEAMPAMAPPPAPKADMAKESKKKSAARRSRAADVEEEAAYDDMSSEMAADVRSRDRAEAPMFRSVDKTQEWAENNWWHRYPHQSGAEMITANRFWRDYAAHRATAATQPFLSAGLGLCANSFAEAMCALAVCELPFVSGAHVLTPDGAQLQIATVATALAGSSQLVDGDLVTGGAPLVVGTSFVRSDDRYDWVDGEQVDKYVDGTFATGVVYTCQVVLANPTSARQRVAALIQIPRGSIAVAGAKATTTIDVALHAYGTHGHEVSFYFPADGTWTQFPVHVSRGGAIVAAAPPRTLVVTSASVAADPRSWAYLSQHASPAEVAQYLATANLAAIDLERVAWRMKDRAAYELILTAVEARQGFSLALWGYALLHDDAPRVRQLLRSLIQQRSELGPVLEMLDLDAEDLGSYEHLELAPLVNARAHKLGPKQRILNNGLVAQYDRFLDLVAHRPSPTAKDLVGAAHYLFAQDRLELALAMFARVDPTRLAEQMQYAYVAAYAACVLGDLPRARTLAAPYREHPVDRWRHRFAALLAMLDEVEGAAPAIVDPRSRDQQQGDLAAKQPTFELAVDRDGVVVTSRNVSALELRFFEMDIELLFSRQPFVQSDVSRFSFIEPGSRATLTQPAAEQRTPWPAALRGKNVVVEAVGAGQRKAKVHYANDLTTSLANQMGQVRVVRASDQRALAATYVKVYARKQGGAVTFYKDGYTDLRGWFDYATLSTNDLDHVERFAILVCSDESGATILETAPPVR